MIHRTAIKIREPVPHDAIINVNVGQSTKDSLLYEIDQLEILEEVILDQVNNLQFNVKDGQYIRKGEIVFTEGFMGHKAMISDFSGIIEIKDNKCRILGQKKHIERSINLEGKVLRVVPGKYVLIQCKVTALHPAIYFNASSKLTPKVYIHSKTEINENIFKFAGQEYTYVINDNLGNNIISIISYKYFN